jgi:hypothetical protein
MAFTKALRLPLTAPAMNEIHIILIGDKPKYACGIRMSGRYVKKGIAA